MNFPSRRTPLALFFCYGFVGVLLGGACADAEDQVPALLRVDPLLLGLPALKPAVAAAPSRSETSPEAAAAQVAPVERAVVEKRAVDEPRPVEKPTVEKSPADAAPVSAKSRAQNEEAAAPARAQQKSSKASAQQIPSRTVAPASAPDEVQQQPAPEPAAAPAATLAPPARTARRAESRPVDADGAASAPADADVPPLSVDPGQVATSPTKIPAKTEAAPRSVVVAAAAPAAVAAPQPAGQKPAEGGQAWFHRAWDPLVEAYNEGDWEFHLPLITYHSRSSYTQEQIDSYQERPLGFGIGKGYYNERGNWEGVFAIGFQDSHFKPSYMAGYSWKSIWRPASDVRLGLGYVAGLMTREDIGNYVPFPVVLPAASVAYKNFSLEAAYVPPFGSNGNVLFIWGKWELGKHGEAVGTPRRSPEPAAEPAEPAASMLARTSGSGTPRVPYGPTVAAATAQGSTGGAVVDGGAAGVAQRATSSAAAPVAGDAAAAAVTAAEPALSPDSGSALALRSDRGLRPLPKDSAVPRPTFLAAQRMGGDVEREFNAEGDAELRKVGTVLNADRLTYWPIDDEIEAEGNVRLDQETSLVTGPKMRLKLEDQLGYFESPSYTVNRKPVKALIADQVAPLPSAEPDDWWNSGFAAPRTLNVATGQTTLGDVTRMPKGQSEGRGEAERMDFEGENHYRVTHGSYTTCAPGNDDWYLKTSTLALDYDREVADGNEATLYFKDTPIFYSPWLSFSLNNARKSGFLPPSYGSSSTSGFEIGLPYYWNIAPNMDATFTPTVLTKRGMMLESEARYLNTAFGGQYNGELKFDVLPDDRERNGDTRYAVSLQGSLANTNNGWTGAINYTRVSDDNYFTDLSRSISSTSQVNLLQQGTVTYARDWWSATANVQSYQTLQPDSSSYNTYPYQLMPQLTFNGRQADLYSTDTTLWAQYTNFTIKQREQNGTIYPDGQRVLLYPQVSLPYVTPGWYVTPKFGVNYASYELTGQASGVPATQERTLPIFSVDSGMTFERQSSWFGRDYTQTLEPRLYYLNVPYRDQSQIPVFDTALADFNFAQIFSENQYSGWDRVSNANQLTAAVTTRLIEPESGGEIARVMFGQRYYFEQNKVLLPGATTTTDNWQKSAWLASFSGQVLPRVYADTALEYDGALNEVNRYSIAARYQPEPGKVFNAEYRYNRSSSTPVDQVDFSAQWPIARSLYGVGRFNYSFKDDASNVGTTNQGGRVIQALGGLEYNGGCWVLRGVLQRIATTTTTESTGFYVQLELSDFSRIGSNPLNILKGNIQGYSLINQPSTLSAQ